MLSIKPQTAPKQSLQITCESLSYSLPVCFLYDIFTLNSWAKGNQPQKVTLMNHEIMQQSYLDFYVQRCLLKILSIKKIMKISPSIIESIAVEGCLFVDCILLIYFWGAFYQGSLAHQSYHIRFKLLYKIYKGIY